MSGKEYTIQPKFMSATSVLIPPDNTQAMITFYSHEFTHAPSNTNAEGQMQIKVDLVPQESIIMTPNQAILLAESLITALKTNGLWKE
ncbi:hypothetical protein ACTFZM_27840 [Klebsiella pneumoniae]|nr:MULTISPECIES: hypothetical protein [Enterobacteriaceae]EJC7953404.1 hypothetical protein [Escherichia coli]MBI9689208.1 hypothetical protein [Escherichia coli]MBR7316937.1 hypothetical protein [Klebsiella pneumoniae]MBS6908419.1 hypothetical protein [Klebsiella sp.]MCH0792067.1 hypothetical protein [Klebsiella pneumoniae]